MLLPLLTLAASYCSYHSVRKANRSNPSYTFLLFTNCSLFHHTLSPSTHPRILLVRKPPQTPPLFLLASFLSKTTQPIPPTPFQLPCNQNSLTGVKTTVQPYLPPLSATQRNHHLSLIHPSPTSSHYLNTTQQKQLKHNPSQTKTRQT